LSNVFRLLNSEAYTDVEFRLTDNSKLKLHRSVLAARSGLFNIYFQNRWKDKAVVRIRTINPDIFKGLIRYIYTGAMSCEINDFQEYLRMARKCKLPGLDKALIKAVKESEFSGTNTYLTPINDNNIVR